MSLPDISFDNIRPYDDSRNTGFEELCAQLASLEPRPADATYFRTGRGADAGVECLIRFADSSETGWQSKYLPNWEKSLSAQLDKSIRAALNKRPKLTRYIVCIPFDLSDAQKGNQKSSQQKWLNWKARWDAVALKEKRPLSIELWSKSDISRRLTSDDAAYAGRLLYWFGLEALTPKWFEEQFGKARESLGSRYTPETNVQLPIRKDLLAFCRDPFLNKQIDKWRFALVEGRSNVASVGKIASAADAAEREDALAKLLEDAIRAFDIGSVLPDQPYPLSRWNVTIGALQLAVRESLDWVWLLPDSKATGASGTSPEEWARHSLYKLYSLLSELLEDFSSDRWRLANARAVLLHGPAGIGKSHLLADVVEGQIHQTKPALLVLGSQLIDGEPWRQIMTGLDLPPTQQVKNFLGSLDAAAQAAGVRAVICVDAINERHGTDIWPERLASFLKTVEPFPRVCIVLSCRTTYLPYVVPEDLDREQLERIEHEGFSADGGEAARVYLDRRGIVRPGAPNPAAEFENPLFLKTCCDFLEKEGKREMPRGLRGITSIFEFYNAAVVRNLTKRMKLDPRQDLVTKGISGFAQLLIDAEIGYLPKAQAIAFFETVLASSGKLEQSLLAQLENEGLLAIEPVRQDDGSLAEMVRFTFERMSDHAIAARLLGSHLDTANPTASFAKGSHLNEFAFGDRAYRRAGIIEALAIQLPERAGVEIVDLDTRRNLDWTIEQAFTSSLLWRDQARFTDRTFEILKKLKNADEVNDVLITIATEPENKFNAEFLHKNLMRASMPERDRHWSIYVALGDNSGDAIETLVAWTLRNGMDQIADDRAALIGVTLTWFLSTTNRSVRDKATKALASLLAKRPKLAAELLGRFASVNDPYVLERLLAAIYGGVLQGVADADLSILSQRVYAEIFEHGAPPLNALTRDHANGIIEYIAHRKLLADGIDLKKARPPYASPWPLEYAPKELIETYTEAYGNASNRHTDRIVSSAVHDGDFARYCIDSLAAKWSVAPLGSVNLPNTRDVFLAWAGEFLADASEEQGQALDAVLEAAKAVKDVYLSKETPEKLALKAAQENFRALMLPDQWEDYCVRAKSTIETLHAGRHGRDQPARFSTQWARRWICKRAHELGWSEELFSRFDGSRGWDRHDHRIERIGKKYQWLALQELAARLSDNLVFMGDSYGDDVRVYESARQANLRDIDPSLLVTSTHYDGWEEWGKTWWLPIELTLASQTPLERRAWLDSDDDIINDAKLIEVRNPKDGRNWLVLHGFGKWNQYGEGDERRAMERDTWCRINCVVVRQKHKAKLVAHLKTQMLTDSSKLPEVKIYGDQYLGEYPWHPSVAHFGDWTGEDEWNPPPVPIRATHADYLCERGGYDYSIDKTVSVELPTPWLAEAMGLRLSNGRNLTFVGPNGQVEFFDPSVLHEGPQAALVDREAFLAMLEREGLAAVWVIAGEKTAYSGDGFRGVFGGSVLHTGIYHYKNGTLERHMYFEREDPTEDQLVEFFGDRPVPPTLTRRVHVQGNGLARRVGKDP